MREVTEKPDGSSSVYNHLLENLGEDRNAEKWISYLSERGGQDRAIVELGAGYGNLSIPLWRNGFLVTAVDLNDSALSHIRRRTSGGVRAVRADFCRDDLPMPANLVLLRSCMVNIVPESSCSDLFCNVARSVNAGGIFIVEMFRPDIITADFCFENEFQTVRFLPGPDGGFYGVVEHKELHIVNKEVVKPVRRFDLVRLIGDHFQIVSEDQLTPLTVNVSLKRL